VCIQEKASEPTEYSSEKQYKTLSSTVLSKVVLVLSLNSQKK
jgi:hypothetical protein